MTSPTIGYMVMGVVGVVGVGLGLFVLLNPEGYWKFYRSQAAFWQGVHAERGETWGCWTTFNGIAALGLGIFILGSMLNMISMDVEHAQQDATRHATATQAKIQRVEDITPLTTIFTPLLPELQARAESARGDILQLSKVERTQYGLGSSPVYFSVCGHNGVFYIVVKDWGSRKASYQYGGALEFVMTDYSLGTLVGCGGARQSYGQPRWTEIEPSSFVYENELNKTRAAPTATP